MAKFRDFEVLYEDIIHLDKSLTLNQAIAVLIVESFFFTHEEKVHVSLVVCKLEYLRFKKRYTDELGSQMYPIICDIFNEKTKFRQHLDLGVFLTDYLKSQNLRITQQDYARILPIVAPYFKFNPDKYKAEAFKTLFPPPKRQTQIIIPPKNTPQDKKSNPLFFPWRKRNT